MVRCNGQVVPAIVVRATVRGIRMNRNAVSLLLFACPPAQCHPVNVQAM